MKSLHKSPNNSIMMGEFEEASEKVTCVVRP